MLHNYYSNLVLNFIPQQIFLETLRLYPPISGLNKVSLGSGTTLSGYHIPAGTLISVGCSLSMHDKSSWEPFSLIITLGDGTHNTEWLYHIPAGTLICVGCSLSLVVRFPTFSLIIML